MLRTQFHFTFLSFFLRLSFWLLIRRLTFAPKNVTRMSKVSQRTRTSHTARGEEKYYYELVPEKKIHSARHGGSMELTWL